MTGDGRRPGTASGYAFDLATAVSGGPERWAAEVDGGWTVAGRPNGGYLLALVARLSKNEFHRHVHVARIALDADSDQRSAIEVRFNHVHRHMAPAKTGLEERMLGAEIRQSPSQRRENAEAFAF